MLDSTKIRREIARQYNKDPQGWNVLVGKDRAGFYDALISHGSEGWQVKEYQVNPYKFVGLGSRLPRAISPQIPVTGSPFGLRPIGVDMMKEIASFIEDPRTMSDLAARLLSGKPVSSREAMESPVILQGPILQSSNPLGTLSTSHSKLDAKMRMELQRLINKEFRHTVTPYI